MMRMLAWLAPAQRSKAVFRGGQAPARWRRALMQKTEGVSTIRRGGAWTQAFEAVSPRMCEGPRFGRTLALLTGQTRFDQDDQPKSGRQGKGALARPEKPPEPKRAKTAAQRVLEATLSVPSTASLSMLQAHADRSLLNRLAGDKFSFTRPYPEQARSSSAKAAIGALAEGAEPGRHRSLMATKSGETRFPSLRPDASALREWLGRLVQRAGEAVAQQQPFAVPRKSAARRDERLPELSPTLRTQWALPLEGACASQELLNRFAHKTQDDEDHAGVMPRRVSRNQEPSFSDELKGFHPVDSSEKSSTRASGSQWASFAHNVEFGDTAWSQSGRSERSAAEDDREGLRASVGQDHGPGATGAAKKSAPSVTTERRIRGQADDGETRTIASATDVRPGMTTSVAAQQAARRTGVQPPSSAAWRGEGAEQMKAMDEMDELAEKIKRILEDQARRHGIDI